MDSIPLVKNAVLMAAGLGTRMRPFSQSRCKAVLPVLGVPVAEFALQSLAAAGVEKIVANVHHDSARTAQVLRGVSLNGTQLKISDETDLLLGSAGALRKALPLLGEGPFFRANGDGICDVDWQKLAATHFRLRRQWGVTLTLAIFKKSPPHEDYREILLDPNSYDSDSNSESGLIRGLGELGREKPFFAGAAVIELEALRNVPEGVADFVSLVLKPAIQKRQAGFYLTDGMWFDVGSPRTWLETHLGLINALESGRFVGPTGSSTLNGHLWRRLLEKNNIRRAQGLWVSRQTASHVDTTQWQGPSYWDSQGVKGSAAPRSLGPHAVLYGSPKLGQEYAHGIGFDGHWVSEV